MKDLKRRAVRGGFAKICGQAANFVLRIVSMMVLSRLLDPVDFGLVAMVTAVTGAYGLFTTAGLSAATIQKATVTDEQLSTLFWVNMLFGTILAILCLATAPVLVRFYHEPRLLWITIAVAAGFLFSAAGVQHSALLERQLHYVALSAIEVTSQLISTTVGIGMAIAGFGYWALVAAAIVPPIVSVVCLWVVTAWVPGMPRRGIGILPMLRFGGTITLNGLIVYVVYNLEKVLLGRFWGAEALGLYGRAYQLINIPTANINEAVGAVAFSALSRVQDDAARLRGYFLKGYSLVVSVTLPVTLFSALAADDIVLVLLGPKWQETAIIFRLLTPTIFIFSIINPLAWLMISTGLQDRSLKIALVIAPLVVTAYAVGLPYGPRGVALAYSAVMTMWLIPHIIWCLHGTVISPSDLVTAVRGSLISGFVAAAVTFGLQFFLGHVQAALVKLSLDAIALFGTYTLMLLFVMGQKTFYIDLLKGLKRAPESS